MLDRENISIYELTVVAYDLGSPSLSSNVTLIINVVDINDSPPVFTEDSYYLLSTDNVAVDDTILTVMAVDADSGDDRFISYVLNHVVDSPVTPFPFTIKEDTGEIIVTSPLCTEVTVTYIMIVTAQDKPAGTLAFETDTTVTIAVYDDNSGTPSFHKDVLVLHTPDGTMNGSSVGSVIAKDDNICSYPLQYTMLPMYDYAMFTYDNQTSTLYTNMDLDQSQQNVYKVKLRVEDINTATTKSSMAVVYIIVGQIVPLSMSSTSGLPVSTIDNTEDNLYIQNYNYFHNAYETNKGQISATFTSSIIGEVDYVPLPNPATNVEGILATDTVYYDLPLIYVALLLTDEDGSDVYPNGVTIYFTITLNGESYQSNYTVTESSSIVIQSIDVPTSWFTNGGSASVSYNINGQVAYTLDTLVTVVAQPVATDKCFCPGWSTE